MSIEPLPAPVYMLDVASYDGREILTTNPFTFAYHPTDWSLAKARWPAVIIKQGQGLDVDPLFHDQFQAAEGHVWRGIYHYFDADSNAIKSAHGAADALEAAGGYGELGVFLDLEKNPSRLNGAVYLANVASWLYEMNKRMRAFGSDAPLGIYTRASFWNPLYDQAQNTAWVAKYPAWVAVYPYDKQEDAPATYRSILDGALSPPKPLLPKGFKLLFAWQWTEKGRPADIPGYPPYKKSVDMNLLYYGPSAHPPELPGGTPADEVAARLDELDRLQAAIDQYFKKRRKELAGV